MLFKDKKSGIYHFRKRYPKDVAQGSGREIFKRSLGTPDKRLALEKFPAAELAFHAAVREFREHGRFSELKFDTFFLNPRRLAKLKIDVDPKKPASPIAQGELYKRLIDRYQYLLSAIEDGRGGEIEVVESSLNSQIYKTKSEQLIEIQRAMYDLYLMLCQQHDKKRLSVMLYNNELARGKVPGSDWGGTAQQILSSSSANSITTIFDKWRMEEAPSEDTLREWRTTLRYFIELHGDLSVSDITKHHARTFKEALIELPKGLSKYHRKLKLPELLEMARRGAVKGETLSPGTINKHIAGLSSVMSFAVKNGYADSNPFSNMRVKERGQAKNKRSSYSAEDLKLIFHSPLYTGCVSKTIRDKAGPHIFKDSKYWLPLLALYTGARIEELGQCQLSDVRQKEGITYLDFNLEGEAKSLKTESSARKVPLHNYVLEKGFLDYVEDLRKQGAAMLFPDLKVSAEGKFTKVFSQWYGRYARGLGITDPKKVFHSFRHTFKDACRNARIPMEMHDRLTGHTTAGVGAIYGDGYDLSILNEEVQKISYPI